MGNFASFCFRVNNDVEKANALFTQALKQQPDHVNNLCKYATFLSKTTANARVSVFEYSTPAPSAHPATPVITNNALRLRLRAVVLCCVVLWLVLTRRMPRSSWNNKKRLGLHQSPPQIVAGGTFAQNPTLRTKKSVKSTMQSRRCSRARARWNHLMPLPCRFVLAVHIHEE